MVRPVYTPTLRELPDGTWEQSYTANAVQVSEDLLALGELLPDRRRGLPYGTPIHSLLIHLDEEGAPEAFELNDQGNTVPRKAVTAIEVTRDAVRLTFAQGKGPRPGRVSLDPEIEIFAPPKKTSASKARLGALRVTFEASPAVTKKLRDVLTSPRKPAV